MGLDIYVYRVKKNQLTSTDVREVYKQINDDAVTSFSNKCRKMFAVLKKAMQESINNDNPKIYKDAFLAFKRKLIKDVRYKTYEFCFPFEEKREYTIDEVDTQITNEIKDYYRLHDAYFRKVNFIYGYFSTKLVDECCIASKEDIDRLVNVCREVLTHHNTDEDNGVAYASENLPTHTGFFFGSYEYDDWYWSDVKDCIKQMSELSKTLKEGDMVLFYFSW